MLTRLQEAGFVEAGHWELGAERAECQLVQERASYNVLYAFVMDGEVVYVGKTTKALRDRMYQYQRPGPTQRTNLRINAAITEKLKNGASVAVFVLPDRGNREYQGFSINLAAAIEDSVIREIQPRWNKAGR